LFQIAEEAGAIGRWVLGKAMDAETHWPDDVFVAINVSALQFRGGTLLDDLNEVID